MDLHPIVIPSSEHIYKSIKYTCSGEGLYKDGYLYDPYVEKILPRKKPKVPKIPTNEVTQPDESHPKPWWKAQCAFRGLNQSGSVADLQLRLREAKKKMLLELKEIETHANKEFKKQNKIARDGRWDSLKTVEQKAKADPHRFLNDNFPKGATGRPSNLDVIVVKIHERALLAAAAEKLGLESVSVDAPRKSGKRPSPNRWIIVGRTRDAVWNLMRDIEREATTCTPKVVGESEMQKTNEINQKNDMDNANTSKVKNSTPRAKKPKVEADKRDQPPFQVVNESFPEQKKSKKDASSSLEVPTPPRPKQLARRGGAFMSVGARGEQSQGGIKSATHPEPKTATKGVWDCTGSYSISCSTIEQGWDCEGDLTMDIYLEKVGSHRQLWAIFQFRILEGIMRFQNPALISKYEKADDKKRKWEYDDDDDDDDDGHSNTYSMSDFHLNATDKPSAEISAWRYRWRGRETGEGEIQLYSDQKLGIITFKNKGAELHGTINSGCAGECSFKGTKIGSAPAYYNTPDGIWEEYNFNAYERARIGRWR